MKPIIYTNTNCSSCKMVKKLFERSGVDFEEINLSESLEDREKLKDLGFKSTPITFYGGDYIAGFSPDKLKKLISAINKSRENGDE